MRDHTVIFCVSSPVYREIDEWPPNSQDLNPERIWLSCMWYSDSDVSQTRPPKAQKYLGNNSYNLERLTANHDQQSY